LLLGEALLLGGDATLQVISVKPKPSGDGD
jgi:hypothetical protein